MRRRISIVLTCLSAALVWQANLSCFAKLSAEQLQEALKKEGVLRGAATVSVQGPEILISTYRVSGASDRDCQVDAVLAAKTAFEKDPELARVLVRFYDVRSTSNYIQMVVTVGEVAAFGAGSITREQLFAGMTVERHGMEAQLANVASAETKSADVSSSDIASQSSATGPTTVDERKSATELATASPKLALASAIPIPGRTSQKAATVHGNIKTESVPAYGLSFSHPPRWTAETIQGTNTLVRYWLDSSVKQPAVIELKVYSASAMTPGSVVALPSRMVFEDAWRAAMIKGMPGMSELMSFAEENARARFGDAGMARMRMHMRRQYHDDPREWRGVRVTPVAVAAAITIGAQKNIKATQKAFYAAAGGMSEPVYMRTVVFGSPHYTYQINMVSPKVSAQAVNAEFEQLLSSLAVAGVSAGAKKK